MSIIKVGHSPVSESIMTESANQFSGKQYMVHLLRTTQQQHARLTGMADQKANILIGASLILLTFLSSQLFDGRVNPPFIALATTSTIAGIFAIMVLMPRVKPVSTTDENFNLLFFGHFAGLTLEDFHARMKQTIADEDQTYVAMIHDIYGQGRLLEKKYRYLKYSYQVFLAGWILAFILYLVGTFR